MTDKTIIFTDGASRGNPGPGGWGAIIVEGTQVKEIGGGETRTTNNRMELDAAINALKEVPAGAKVKLYTDSQYLINGITKWINAWMKNEWKTKEKKDVLNKEYWQNLHKACEGKEIEWLRVKGHSNIGGNERCDEIATHVADGNKPILFKGDMINYDVDVAEPTEEQMSESSDRERKNSKAYSYLSLVDGGVQRHSDWADCKARVDGQKGAKFRKSISKEDEEDIVRGWGIK